MPPLLEVSDVEVGLVKGERFDQLGVAGKDGTNLCRDLSVEFEADGQDDQSRAKLAGLEDRHGRVKAEFSRWIIAGREHPAAGGTADRDGFFREFRTLTYLHGCVKAVHVDVDNASPGVHCWMFNA